MLTEEQGPIMIVGIRPRCGTNYLCDLISLHPAVVRPSPIDEDYFIAHADKLELFAQSVGRHWSNLSNPVPDTAQQDVLRALGVGLLGWLSALAGSGRLLTKTPVPGRLDLFFDLFPAVKLLIIVRDGRSVVESHMKSWPGDSRFGDDLFTGLITAWVQSAEIIQRFRTTHPVTAYPYMLLRYEDLVRAPEDMVEHLLGFLSLEPVDYDFDAVAQLPVRGSSVFGRQEGTPLHWKPVPKTDGFDPLDRWSHWSADRHALFNQLAGDAMRNFGYTLQDPS